MNRTFLRNLLILAGIALVVAVLNLQIAVLTIGMILRFAFFLAIAVVAYFYWRDFGRREIEMWTERASRVFYAAVALFVVDVGWYFLGGLAGRDVLAFFLVAAACVFVAVRTWREQKKLT
jgi:hypothetical protein